MKREKLTDETKERACACESPEELMTLAEAEGIYLSDEEMEGVAGGSKMVGVAGGSMPDISKQPDPLKY